MGLLGADRTNITYYSTEYSTVHYRTVYSCTLHRTCNMKPVQWTLLTSQTDSSFTRGGLRESVCCKHHHHRYLAFKLIFFMMIKNVK